MNSAAISSRYVPELLTAMVVFAVAAVCGWLVLRVLKLTKRVGQLEMQVRTLQDSGTFRTSAEPVARAKDAGSVRAPIDWEALVGTNWLNRIGALMLVIGIVLFVGYSLTQLGPVGKITVGALLGTVLLGGGTLLSRREAWQTYSFSLMGAGWAVLYFTSYASYGLPAARVLTSPATATVLLVLVSAGMIIHSVAYRSEAATALSYLLGFAGLNVSPLTEFSLFASVLLAAALSGVAYRYRWSRLPVLGAALAYATFVIRYGAQVSGAQAALWCYWITFEVYDLLEARRNGRTVELGRTMFLINIAGFAGASWLHRVQTQARDWVWICLLACVAYLASAILRRYCQSTGEQANAPADQGYELASAGSAAMLFGGIIDRFGGPQLTFALLFEAELVFLAAITLRARLLLAFATFALLVPVVHVGVDSLNGARWSAGAAGVAAVLIFNRCLVPGGWYFTAFAGLLASAAAAKELPDAVTAPAIAAVATAAQLVPARDVRWSALAAVVASAAMAYLINVPRHDVAGAGLVAAALFVTHRLWRLDPATPVRLVLTIIGVLLTTALLWEVIPSRLLTVACAAEAALLLAAGFVLPERTFRLTGLAILLVCLIRLFAFDLRQLDTLARIISFLLLGILLLGASWVYTRHRNKLDRLL